MEGFGGMIPTQIGQLCLVLKLVVERHVLGGKVWSRCTGLTRNGRPRHGNAIQIEIIEAARGSGNQSRWGDAAGREISDLKVARCKCIDDWFGLVIFLVANGRDFAAQGMSPGLACEEAG